MSEVGIGQSVKSIDDGFDCNPVYSAVESVKTGYVRVSIAGPDGYHGSVGAKFAWAN